MPKTEPDWEKERIARLIYRNDEIHIEHLREVLQLESYLGSIAGMYDLLMYFIFFVFGSYIDFISRVKWIRGRYRFENEFCLASDQQCNHRNSVTKMLNAAKGRGMLELKNMNLTQFYFRNESPFRILCCCIKRSVKELSEKKLIDRGTVELEQDFNYKNVIDRMRLCQFETDQMNNNQMLNYDDFSLDNKIRVVIRDEDFHEEVKNVIFNEFKSKIQSMFNKKILIRQETGLIYRQSLQH